MKLKKSPPALCTLIIFCLFSLKNNRINAEYSAKASSLTNLTGIKQHCRSLTKKKLSVYGQPC